MIAGQTCENCAAFSAMTNECRRKAPVMMPVQGPNGQPAAMGLFPATSKERWCGEWMREETRQ
jgi:hypothetical protein